MGVVKEVRRSIVWMSRVVALMSVLVLQNACTDREEPDPFAYDGDIITAVINGDQEFEASGDINGQELVFALLQTRILIITGIDRNTIDPLTFRISSFDGVGTYEIDVDNTASYVLFDDERNSTLYVAQSGELRVESFDEGIAIGSFDFEASSRTGALNFTEGRFAVLID